MTDQTGSGSGFKFSPYVPYDPTERSVYMSYVTTPHKFGVQPYQFTGWRDESMSWKENCYIHSNLNPTWTYRIKGPDSAKLISGLIVNTFNNFPVGKGKHAIICNKDGFVRQHGLLMRTDEDEYISCWLSPTIKYITETSKYNVVGQDLTGKVFLFQLGGPRSLEILETATGECLHDIKFMHHRVSSIDGRSVRIIRMGMAGSLAYETHGILEDAIPVYTALLKAGKQFGLRKLGDVAYAMTHWENGFPQGIMDFPYAWYDDKDFLDHVVRAGGKVGFNNVVLSGSMGTDINLRYRNPVELGYGAVIKFDHEFMGREALEKIVAKPKRKMVTLVWNVEDILDAFRSQFEKGETYAPIDAPMDYTFVGPYDYHADQVLKDGKVIGISTGRMNSYYYRDMISICSIDVEHSQLGNEVIVLWGNPGTRQKEIRAIVSRYPYFNENRNEAFDVSQIPCVAPKAK
ncbi:MAG TPA: hypothetical protein VKF36_00485 [Syntrophorhabdales bacterium]|nr:hypothetical protein [Syntrophorhabdales bacterium]